MMRQARIEKVEGEKVARHTINNLRYSGGTTLKALPHVTISSTFHRRRWNIVDIVDDEPATRNDNVNDADVK